MKTADTEKREKRYALKLRNKKAKTIVTLLVRKFGQRPLTSKYIVRRIAIAGTNEVFNVEHVYEQDDNRRHQ